MRKPLLAALWPVLLLGACVTPLERVDHLAATAGFQKSVVAGESFDHLVFTKQGPPTARRFHVYIEGDGTPWFTRHRIAIDPTPRQPLMLEVMAGDPAPSIYLGRPCYFELKRGCSPEDWTGRRYSDEVVDSMATALGKVRRRLGWPGKPVLIGHSGGGVLAMLLAARAPDTAEVLTVAANLDIDAWTRLHNYTPLSGSLNPAEAEPLPSSIRQLHLVGGRDDNVPPRITRSGLARQENAEVVRYPHQGHQCCWRDIWPDILRGL